MFEKRKTNKTKEELVLEALREVGIDCDFYDDENHPYEPFQIKIGDEIVDLNEDFNIFYDFNNKADGDKNYYDKIGKINLSTSYTLRYDIDTKYEYIHEYSNSFVKSYYVQNQILNYQNKMFEPDAA